MPWKKQYLSGPILHSDVWTCVQSIPKSYIVLKTHSFTWTFLQFCSGLPKDTATYVQSIQPEPIGSDKPVHVSCWFRNPACVKASPIHTNTSILIVRWAASYTGSWRVFFKDGTHHITVLYTPCQRIGIAAREFWSHPQPIVMVLHGTYASFTFYDITFPEKQFLPAKTGKTHGAVVLEDWGLDTPALYTIITGIIPT